MRNLKILVVDDDQDFAHNLGIMCGIQGHQVTLAFTGEEAVHKYREGEFDITFMDVKLPNMNGVDSFFEVRKINSDAQVMMMTAYAAEEVLTRAIGEGAMGILQKPFDQEHVLEILAKVNPASIILVADDDEDFLRNIEIFLSEHDLRVQTASDGKVALERVCANGIDVLILDLRLPIMSGLEVYMSLKRQHIKLPTVIVTGFAPEEDEVIKKFRSMGVVDCLRKPFDPNNLLTVIDQLIASSDEPISR